MRESERGKKKVGENVNEREMMIRGKETRK